MEMQLVQQFEDFLGARVLNNGFKRYLKQHETPFPGTLYRGMLFPKPFLKAGETLHEWHGSSHWSKQKTVSLSFARDGYINEDYCDELSNEHGIDEPESVFVPVLFCLNQSERAIDVHSMIQDVNALAHWHKEQEVSFIGLDFMMKQIHLIEDDEGDYYLVEVVEK